MNKEEKSHPSYGMVGFYRTDGNAGQLFGSNLSNHYTTVRLRIKQGVTSHDLNTSWFRGTKPIIDITLSQIQFCELMTTMNVGDGVPCTINYINGEAVEKFQEEKLEPERIKDDFKNSINDIRTTLKSFRTKLTGIFSSKSHLSVSSKEEILNEFNNIIQKVCDELPFVLTSFHQSTTKLVSSAKAEVDAFVSHLVYKTGFDNLVSKSKQVNMIDFDDRQNLLLEENNDQSK